MAKSLLFAQGGYYLATGLWPFVSIASFQAVTGPKTEGWLVRMVGALAAVIGGVLVVAGGRRRATTEVQLLASGSALAFMSIDVTYVARRRISPVYLADAVLQVFILLGWFIRLKRSSPASGAPHFERA